MADDSLITKKMLKATLNVSGMLLAVSLGAFLIKHGGKPTSANWAQLFQVWRAFAIGIIASLLLEGLWKRHMHKKRASSEIEPKT